MIIDGKCITPSEGFKYITNGKTWAREILLGKNDLIDAWRDTNDEPPTPEEPITPEEFKMRIEAIL